MSHFGGVPERPKGAGCKPVGSAYGGSNPPSPTQPPSPRIPHGGGAGIAYGGGYVGDDGEPLGDDSEPCKRDSFQSEHEERGGSLSSLTAGSKSRPFSLEKASIRRGA